MKRYALVFVLCLLVPGSAGATFELEDPAQELNKFQTVQEAENANRPTPVLSSTGLVQLAKKDYLKLLVGTYVNGFHQFDTTIWTSDEIVKVRIFHGPDEQDAGRAEQLAKQFRDHLQMLLGDPGYKWANDVKIEVSVFEIQQ